jgi:hypothetical protein
MPFKLKPLMYLYTQTTTEKYILLIRQDYVLLGDIC